MHQNLLKEQLMYPRYLQINELETKRVDLQEQLQKCKPEDVSTMTERINTADLQDVEMNMDEELDRAFHWDSPWDDASGWREEGLAGN